MTPISAVIELIQTNNPTFTVREARALENEMPPSENLPLITVGYGPIRSRTPEANIAYDFYNTNGEDVLQSFYVTIACKVADFHTVFVDVFKTLTGENPIPDERYHTSYTYVNGEPAGLNNTTFWFWMEWKIGFPTNSLL